MGAFYNFLQNFSLCSELRKIPTKMDGFAALMKLELHFPLINLGLLKSPNNKGSNL
jgi:hypothetical protein